MPRKSYPGLLTALIIVALTFIVFSQTLTFDFVNWGDDVYLYENIRVQSFTPENIFWFFSHPYYHSYIPLTMVSHMIDFELWGFNPSGHHAGNAALHSLNAFWVFVLSLQVFSLIKNGLAVRRMRELLFEEMDPAILFSSLLATLLYALHPLRVESVAWVSDREDLLCAFFLLPSIIDYVNYVAARETKRATRWYVASFVLFVFACLSKSIAIIAPVVFLLMDYFLLRREFVGRQLKTIVLEKVPLIIISIIAAAIAASTAPAVSDSDMFESMSPIQRAFLPFYSLIFYFAKTLLPINLSLMYPLPGEGEMMLYFGAFAAVSILCVWLWKRGTSLPLLAWLCYIVFIAPSSVVASAIIQTTADRYTYLPSVALFLLFGGIVADVWREYSSNKTNQIAIACTGFLLIGFLGFISFRQQKFWMNSETLWGRTIELYPNMPLPYNNFGLALQARGVHDKAEESYARAIQLKPNYFEAHLNLGNSMFAKGNWDEAERLFLRAVELNPNRAEVYNNLGIVANTKGNTLDALHWLHKSIEVNPEYAQGYFNLAALYEKMGNLPASLDALKKAAQCGHRAAQQNLQREGVAW